jgi:hypothetical protein
MEFGKYIIKMVKSNLVVNIKREKKQVFGKPFIKTLINTVKIVFLQGY